MKFCRQRILMKRVDLTLTVQGEKKCRGTHCLNVRPDTVHNRWNQLADSTAV